MQKKPIKKNITKKSPQEYEQQIGELTEHLQRLQAEFENYKKRATQERAEIMSSAKVAVLHDLLPALDNFDRASTHLPAELETNSWAKGMQYIGQHLLTILDSMGIKQYNPMGERFDHMRHEALEHVSSTSPPDTVVEVVTPGYEMNGQVVRPATVRVSSGQSEKQSFKQDNQKGEV